MSLSAVQSLKHVKRITYHFCLRTSHSYDYETHLLTYLLQSYKEASTDQKNGA